MQFFKKTRPVASVPTTARNRFALFGVFIIAGLFSSLGWLARSEAESVAVNDTGAVTVSVINAEKKSIPRSLALSGVVIGREEVAVYADLPQGRISKVLVDEGQYVKAGQILAVTDDAGVRVQQTQQNAVLQRANAALAQQEARVQEAEAQHAQAKNETKRSKAVNSPDVTESDKAALIEQRTSAEHIAEIQVKAAKSELEMAKADVQLANAQIAETTLHLNQSNVIAPVSGLIVKRNAQIGLSLSQQTEPLFVLIRDGTLELLVSVASDDTEKLKNGMPVTIQGINSQQNYTGKVRRAALSINLQDQTANVRVSFDKTSPDKTPSLIPGQSTKVSINLPAKSGIYLPDSALFFEGNAAFVFIVRNNQAVRVPVKVGERLSGQAEILEGVTEGMPVVDGFAAYLHDGDAVKVAPMRGSDAGTSHKENGPQA
ncbi:efflux RND transporter periplasmic adaptor subunit [Methyloradius palustris]|uniref:MexH family multidrug efflux RND transporter periplasmic adaptor subunit n=1 Tax=Methyloradius palustris TaxID=2778876 RepID=A0A8D5G9I8_9PROT|nr:efflux RND transporter periplasmic adaptor subunit [Methyloradius palustris]BCM24121.1 MexH family multidrug efflux RND transporter periplasmic adaptor subunit [Methyloradius palustris]